MGTRKTATAKSEQQDLNLSEQPDSYFRKSRFSALGSDFYSEVSPTPLTAPFWVSCNTSAARLIGASPKELFGEQGLLLFSGNREIPGIKPIAMLYSGHQFGVYVPQLGDGRALLLGEAQGSEKNMEIQIKGAGQTPYSRGADGRAVLRSSIREYLCSEAMHALGIPTTRALCITASHDPVYREEKETAAILTRLSPSHVRFGHFELFYYRQQPHLSLHLANFIISHYYPELQHEPKRLMSWLKQVGIRTARLIAKWQSVGFTHGVLNTDNMSILGLTLDYGPFGFMDSYQHNFVCNHTDTHGRYAFSQQPRIGLWNLHALVQSLSFHLTQDETLEILETYTPVFEETWLGIMRAKLGLMTVQPDDETLILNLLDLLDRNRIDYTRFMRQLSRFNSSAQPHDNSALRDTFPDRDSFDAWANHYAKRLSQENSHPVERALHMNQVNPKYILRNYLADLAIQQARQGDFSEIDRLLALLQHPYDEQPDNEHYANLPPEWASSLDLSCSS